MSKIGAVVFRRRSSSYFAPLFCTGIRIQQSGIRIQESGIRGGMGMT